MTASGDEQLLIASLERVPGATRDQLEQLLGTSSAGSLLTDLEKRGIVQRRWFQVRRVERMDGPLIALNGESISREDASRIAASVRKRYGSPAMAEVFSLGPLRRPCQIDHEIGVTDVFLWYRRNRADWRWVGESPKRGERIPDATAVSRLGEVVAIDFAGEYRSAKIRALATDYAFQGSALELW